MNQKFVKSLVKQSREFLSLAKVTKNDDFTKDMYLKASVAFSWFGLEGFVNLFFDDFIAISDSLELHEVAFLKESKIEFDQGNFEIKGNKYNSTKDKILFLLLRFGNYKVDKSSKLWQRLNQLEDIRNLLVHPKRNKQNIKQFQIKHAQDALDTIIEIIKLMYKKINKKDIIL